MIRTQIYLTEQQRNELAAIAKSFGKKQSELIRESIDSLIKQAGKSHRELWCFVSLLEFGRIERIFLILDQFVPDGTGDNNGEADSFRHRCSC